MSAAATLRAEVMAQPPQERLGYALDLLAFYLDPLPEYYAALADAGLRISAQEARILHALDRRRGQYVTADALLAAAQADRPADEWPEVAAVYPRLATLRAQLAQAGLPVTLRSWPGVGFRLVAPEGFVFGRRHA